MRSGIPIFTLNDGTSTTFAHISNQEVPNKLWSYLAVSVDRAANIGRFYLDDNPPETFMPMNNAIGSIENNMPLTIGGNRNGENFAGLIDEVELFIRALSDDTVTNIYNFGFKGKCKDRGVL